MVYLMGAGFKSGLNIELSRDGVRERLEAALQEDYRARVDPGGIPFAGLAGVSAFRPLPTLAFTLR
jgi:hypothetical protein